VFFKWNKLEKLRSQEYKLKTWALKAWSESGVHKTTVKFVSKDKKHVSCLPLINVLLLYLVCGRSCVFQWRIRHVLPTVLYICIHTSFQAAHPETIPGNTYIYRERERENSKYRGPHNYTRLYTFQG